MPTPSFLKKIAAGALLLLLLWSFWFFQPGRQLERRQRQLLAAAQARDWTRVGRLMDDHFRTGPGHDKAETLGLAREGLGDFFMLKIEETDRSVTREGNTATICSRLRLQGGGGVFAQQVVAVVNAQKEPFVFTWKRAGWKPWDWRLTRLDHPLIGLAGAGGEVW